jgi:N-acetylmuramoyl-L-alanine amidase
MIRPRTDWLIVHCAATKPGMDIGAAEIKRWHTLPKPSGNGWSDIGYHYVIRRSGAVEAGRPMDKSGAHVAGENNRSVGICLVGGIDDTGKPEANFTPEQYASLDILLRLLCRVYNVARVRGHNNFAPKACPSFDAVAWAKARGLPV